jgi:hypothetical protein
MPPLSATSSTTNADSPENIVPTRESTAITRS